MRRTDLLLELGGESVQKFGTIRAKSSRGEDGGYTFTRGSTASFNGSSRVEWASTATARVHYVSDEPYLLLEAAATNLIGDTRLNTWPAGTTADVTTTAPDGSTAAGDAIRSFASSGVPGSYTLVSDTFTLSTATASNTFSVYVKRFSTGALPSIGFTNAGSGRGFVAVNWTSTGGVASLTASDGGAVVGSSVGENVGSGWHRIAMSPSTDTPVANDVRLRGSTTAGTASEFAFPQVEATPYMTSQVGGTTAATITRSADTFYVDYPHPPQAATYYAKIRAMGAENQGTGGRVVHVGGAGTGLPRFELTGTTSAGEWQVFFRQGATSRQVIVTNAASYGDTVELRGILTAAGAVNLGVSVNSGSEVVGSQSSDWFLPAAWNDTRLYVGAFDTQRGNIGVRSLKVARGVRSMAEMRAL